MTSFNRIDNFTKCEEYFSLSLSLKMLTSDILRPGSNYTTNLLEYVLFVERVAGSMSTVYGFET